MSSVGVLQIYLNRGLAAFSEQAFRAGAAYVSSKAMHPPLNRISLLITTCAWQVAISALGFAGGLAVVRLLSIEQYAVYTIANSLLGALVVLGDSGISSGVMSQGGTIWQDRCKLGAVVNTALRICRGFAIAAAVLAVPVALLMLGRHGASFTISLAVGGILIPCFVVSVRNTILQIPMKLHQDVQPMQQIQFGSQAVRLLLLGVALPLAPFALVALAVAAVSTAYANVLISRRARLYIREDAHTDPAAHREIMRIVSRTLPGSIYYCIQGQLAIWLVSVFGSTAAVAQLGALGRLGMVASVVSAVATTLVVPRFARIPADRRLLLRGFLIVLVALSLVCGIGLAVVALFPASLLWVLGSSYAGLDHELMLMAISTALSLVGGVLISLCFARGLIPSPLVAIPFAFAAQVLFIRLNDMTTLNGVLLMGVGVSAAILVFYGVYLVIKLSGHKQLSMVS